MKKQLQYIVFLLLCTLLFTSLGATQVSAQEVCTTPLDIMLVIDRSGSMTNPDPQRLADAKTSAISFLDNMDFSQDRAGLASFASSGSLDQALTSNQGSVETAINNLAAGGVTYLGQGIQIAADEINANAINSGVMIILSDGAPNVYPGGFCFVNPTSPTLCTEYAVNQSTLAKNAGIEVFTIGLGVNSFTEDLLKQIASSEDNYFSAADSSDLTSIYEQLSVIVCPCGNGVLDAGEECDDGNNDDDDGCSAACILEFCGDGIVHTGEACDDGNNNNGDGCNSVCEVEACGNGVVDAGEACDDGNSDETDQCDNQCAFTFCGDNTLQSPNGLLSGGINNEGFEECDDGLSGSDQCTNSCLLTFCGDSITQTPNGAGFTEDCDDGANGDSTDQCTDSCEFTFCGDSITQSLNGEGVNEACDDGPQGSNQCNSDCTVTFCGDNVVQTPNGDGQFEACDDGANGDNTDACTDSCELTFCGDGITQSLNGNNVAEQCDDGNSDENDGCTSSCTLTFCGDSITQAPNGNNEIEACDDGNSNEDDQCDNSCELTFCGDGITQSPNGALSGGLFNEGFEECDDGNGVETDACSSSCLLTFCGDGITQSLNGNGGSETCDDGNTVSGDGCNSLCQLEVCGNGVLDAGEDCDDGNTDENDTCNNSCELTFCGDALLQSPNGLGTLGPNNDGVEACDDGANGVDTDQCTNSCTLTFCGDDVVQALNGNNQVEVCDDGANGDNTDACTDSCELTFCGDGITQALNGNGIVEACDDGANGDDSDGCTDSCELTFCGDAIVQQPNGALTGGPLNNGVEACDDGANADDTDQCTDTCELTFCGDGVTQAPNGQGVAEACDDGNNDETDGCTSSCQLTFCGDGVTQAPNGFNQDEDCDDGANGDNTDQCTDSCELTFCGDSITQIFNGEGVAEACDDGANGDDTDGCTDLCELTFCGDGITQPLNGQSQVEQCDDGANGDDSDGCTDSCELTYCGDAIVQQPNGIGTFGVNNTGLEQCDDGRNGDDSDQCTDSCEFTFCGDRITQPLNGEGVAEACDDGANGDNTDGCTDSCELTFCGDGIKQLTNGFNQTEECDGNDGLIENHLCSSSCELVRIPQCDDIGYVAPYHTDGVAEWIDTLSLVNITENGNATCADPNDDATTYYKDHHLVGEFEFFCESDALCGQWAPSSTEEAGWIEYTGDFPAGPESCHVIETYTEVLGLKSNVSWDCVYVDKTAPTPIKEVGTPATLWNGVDLNGTNPYYPEAEEVCQTAECWKLTLTTPITMSCEDPAPHPSGENLLCYKVDFDGQDLTEQYCENFDGDYNYTGDGSCCTLDAQEEIYFGETSYHKLSFYCEDNVQKRSEWDVEYFKVEDEAFSWDLNHKWNLISVPFVLLDDSVSSVFADIENEVLSVWGYDAVTNEWSVYTPDGDDSNDNLKVLSPGRGYWVLMNDTATLTLGGSLFNPAVTPASVPIQPNAWNLIGYYGTNDEMSYSSPEGNADSAECHLASIDENVLGWSSLYGYWEPFNPNQWMPLGETDGLDAGAGYWLYAQEGSASYAPSTLCQ